jgi:hypothetical protein
MTTVRELDPVLITVDAESLTDGRTVLAGAVGTVLAVKPDGTCLVEVALAPQTADSDGDFVQVVLATGQYEVVRP